MAKQVRRAIAIGETAMSTTREVETVLVGAGFSASVNGLVVDGQPEIAAWDEVGKRLRIMEKGAQFALGDFILQLEDRFSEEASQIIDESTGWSLKTCSIYRNLAKNIAVADRRMDRLTISHHLAVVALTAAQQRKWLTKAADDENDEPWTVKRLKDSMRVGEDLVPSGWWVLVLCTSEDDQRKTMNTIEKMGRTVKAVTRHSRATKKGKKR